MKRCSKCKQEKQVGEFYKDADHSDGLDSQCKECTKATRREWDRLNPGKRNEYMRQWNKTHPEQCKEKSRKYYRTHPGHSHDWYVANRERKCEEYAAHPELVWARHLRRKYKITPEDYDAMFIAQGGICAICGQPEPLNRRLAVDHAHDETKRVRGLLCGRCNLAVGYIDTLPGLVTLIRILEHIGQMDNFIQLVNTEKGER